MKRAAGSGLMVALAASAALLPSPWRAYVAERLLRVPAVAAPEATIERMPTDARVARAVAAALDASPGWAAGHVGVSRTGDLLRVSARAPSRADARAAVAAAADAVRRALLADWRRGAPERSQKMETSTATRSRAERELRQLAERSGVEDPAAALAATDSQLARLRAERVRAGTSGDREAVRRLGEAIGRSQRRRLVLDSLRLRRERLAALAERAARDVAEARALNAAAVEVEDVLLRPLVIAERTRGTAARVTSAPTAIASGAALIAAVVLLVGARWPAPDARERRRSERRALRCPPPLEPHRAAPREIVRPLRLDAAVDLSPRSVGASVGSRPTAAAVAAARSRARRSGAARSYTIDLTAEPASAAPGGRPDHDHDRDHDDPQSVEPLIGCGRQNANRAKTTTFWE